MTFPIGGGGGGGPNPGDPAYLDITPQPVNFGTVLASTPASATVTVKCNGSTGIVTINSISVTGVFTLSGLPAFPHVMATGQSFTFSVNINQPTGSYTGVLTVSSVPPTATVNVLATTSTTNVTASPSSLVFPPTIVKTASAPESVVITNNSGSSLTLNDVTSSNPDFTLVTPPPFPVTLANGASTTLDFVMTPTATGNDSAVMSIPTTLAGFTITIPMQGAGILFNEVNNLLGNTQEFLMGFGPPGKTQYSLNPTSNNSDLPQTLIFNNTMWDNPSNEKAVRRLQFYYENLGVCTLTATATVQRYNQEGVQFVDTETSTVTFGTSAADGLEYSAFFDFQIAGEILMVQITRAANVGPYSVYMFIPFIEDKGEKVENV